MIRYFFHYLRYYDFMIAFLDSRPKLKQQAVISGEYAEWYTSRWRFAWKATCVQWKHRDRFSRKCKRNCFDCDAKHCDLL